MTTQTTNPITNQVAYLRSTRTFPLESENLSLEMNKSYVDVANAVNNRTIGIYPTGTSAITGESYFITQNQKQQALRQVFPVTVGTGTPHGLNLQFIDRFVHCYGTWTDGTNWYGAIFASSNIIPGQVTFWITPTTIEVRSQGIAVVSRVLVILEWIVNA